METGDRPFRRREKRLTLKSKDGPFLAPNILKYMIRSQDLRGRGQRYPFTRFPASRLRQASV
jgi:hypothetical protein